VIILIFVLLFSSFCNPSLYAQIDYEEKSENLFRCGQYHNGLMLLFKANSESQGSPEQKAKTLLALANFYNNYVGDINQADWYFNEILKLFLPQNNPYIIKAKDNLENLNKQKEIYLEEDSLLEKAKEICRTGSAEDKKLYIKKLRLLIQKSPSYLNIASVYYHLGELLFDIGNYYDAYKAFDESIKIKPAIGIYLPSPGRKKQSFDLWIHKFIKLLSWSGLLSLFLFSVFLFYLARPWNWLKVSHLSSLILLILFWYLYFNYFIHTEAPQNIPNTYPQPIYYVSLYDSPLSEAVNNLFWIGIIGIFGIYFLTIGLTIIKFFWKRLFISCTLSFLLLACLLSVFYLRNCGTEFQPDKTSKYPYLNGVFYYALTIDQDPFLLTNPKAYPEFIENIDNMDEEELRNWFKKYGK